MKHTLRGSIKKEAYDKKDLVIRENDNFNEHLESSHSKSKRTSTRSVKSDYISEKYVESLQDKTSNNSDKVQENNMM